MDNFESNINESLSQFEVEFNPAHWNEMEARLNAKLARKNYYIGKWAVSGVVLSVIAGVIFSSSPVEKTKDCHVTSEITLQEKATTIKKQSSSSKLITNQPETPKMSRIYEEVEEPVSVIVEKNFSDDDLQTEQNVTINNQEEEKEKEKKITDYHATDFKNKKEDVAVISCEKDIYCANEPISFSTKIKENVLWDFGDGYTSVDQNPHHKFEMPGEYIIKLIVNDVETNTKKIKINPIPEVFFDIKEPSEFDIDQEYRLSASNFGAQKTKWLINGEIINENSNEIATSLYNRGNYKIELIGENELKCQNIFQKKVFVEKDYDLLAPKSFSPNGDGRNEYWIPGVLKMEAIDFELTIFNRSGKLVFKTNSADNPWDGTCLDNTKAKPLETYIWNAIYTNNKGERNIAKGGITIID